MQDKNRDLNQLYSGLEWQNKFNVDINFFVKPMLYYNFEECPEGSRSELVQKLNKVIANLKYRTFIREVN